MILAVIPAKATSRRVPGKNLRPLAGKPLWEWTLRAAIGSQCDRVVVSSDSLEIGGRAMEEGADFVHRPSELARDPAEAPDVALHALQVVTEERGWHIDTVVMLLPTSPFRTDEHIDEALALHMEHPHRPNVLSVVEAPEIQRKLHRLANGGVMAAEKLPDRLLLNGAIWIAPADRLRRDRYFSGTGALPYRMDPMEGIDIDTEADFAAAEWIAANR